MKMLAVLLLSLSSLGYSKTPPSMCKDAAAVVVDVITMKATRGDFELTLRDAAAQNPQWAMSLFNPNICGQNACLAGIVLVADVKKNIYVDGQAYCKPTAQEI